MRQPLQHRPNLTQETRFFNPQQPFLSALCVSVVPISPEMFNLMFWFAQIEDKIPSMDEHLPDRDRTLVGSTDV